MTRVVSRSGSPYRQVGVPGVHGVCPRSTTRIAFLRQRVDPGSLEQSARKEMGLDIYDSCTTPTHLPQCKWYWWTTTCVCWRRFCESKSPPQSIRERTFVTIQFPQSLTKWWDTHCTRTTPVFILTVRHKNHFTEKELKGISGERGKLDSVPALLSVHTPCSQYDRSFTGRKWLVRTRQDLIRTKGLKTNKILLIEFIRGSP